MFFLFTGATITVIITVMVGCKTAHTIITEDSTVVIMEAGVATVNQHHGTIIQATTKVRKKNSFTNSLNFCYNNVT